MGSPDHILHLPCWYQAPEADLAKFSLIDGMIPTHHVDGLLAQALNVADLRRDCSVTRIKPRAGAANRTPEQ